MGEVQEAYTQLKKIVRRLNVADSLYTIWAYSRNLQSGLPIPKDISVPLVYSAKDPNRRGIYQWSLEILAKEIIIHARPGTYHSRLHSTLRNADTLGQVLNALNRIDNSIATCFLSSGKILKEFSRIAHRQFPWQQDSADESYLIRYFKLFSFDRVGEIVKSKFGLTVNEIFLLNLTITGMTSKHPSIVQENFEGPFYQKLRTYITGFSTSYESIRSMLIEDQRIDERYLYAGYHLKKYPLVEIELEKSALFCPLPTLFFWRVTSGLYYDLVGERGFNNSFGKSIENYTGILLEKVLTGEEFRIISESKYIVSKSEEHTVDWIVTNKNEALFIECKAKRMTLNSKVELDEGDALINDINTMASNIIKLYKTHFDYTNNFYETLDFHNDRKVYLLILTPESWYLFDESSKQRLQNEIQLGLTAAGIQLDVLNRAPYMLCNLSEFEVMIQIIKQTGIGDFFEPKFQSEEKRSFQIGTYCRDSFPNFQPSFLFADEYAKLLVDSRDLLQKLTT